MQGALLGYPLLLVVSLNDDDFVLANLAVPLVLFLFAVINVLLKGAPCLVAAPLACLVVRAQSLRARALNAVALASFAAGCVLGDPAGVAFAVFIGAATAVQVYVFQRNPHADIAREKLVLSVLGFCTLPGAFAPEPWLPYAHLSAASCVFLFELFARADEDEF